MYTQLDKVGFEIEGEFSALLVSKLKSVGEMKGDGSVHYCPNIHSGADLTTAEYNSHALPASNLKPIQSFFNLLQTYYKKGEFHFNKTCGFHIHVSFLPKFPVELFSKQFTNYFLKALKEKQKNVMTLRSGNSYCRTTINEGELRRDTGDRYKFVNLWPAFHKHGTIEFRIFPSTEPKVMYRYIVFTLAHLRRFLTKPIKIKCKAVIEDNMFRDNIEITVNQDQHILVT